MYLASGWKDYEVLDAGGGEKLERWGDVALRQAGSAGQYGPCRRAATSNKPDAHVYHRSIGGRRRLGI